jgi:hypothetical protein
MKKIIIAAAAATALIALGFDFGVTFARPQQHSAVSAPSSVHPASTTSTPALVEPARNEQLNAAVMCGMIAGNPTETGVTGAVENLFQLGYTVDSATAVADYALNSVCPKWKALFDQTMHDRPSSSALPHVA